MDSYQTSVWALPSHHLDVSILILLGAVKFDAALEYSSGLMWAFSKSVPERLQAPMVNLRSGLSG